MAWTMIACRLAALYLVLQAAAAVEVTVWDQCGGISCQGGPCEDAPWVEASCAAGSACTRKTEYYWQCLPAAQLYAQCGGQSCKAAHCGDVAWAACPKASACVRQSQYYWQCQEENAATESVASDAVELTEEQTFAIASVRDSDAAASKATKAQQQQLKPPRVVSAGQSRPLKSLAPQTRPAAAAKP